MTVRAYRCNRCLRERGSTPGENNTRSKSTWEVIGSDREDRDEDNGVDMGGLSDDTNEWRDGRGGGGGDVVIEGSGRD